MPIDEIRKYMNFIHKKKLIKEFQNYANEHSGIDTNQLMKMFYNYKTTL